MPKDRDPTVLDEYKKDISKLLDKVQTDDEFEIDLNKDKMDISYEKYVEMMRYLTHLHSMKKINIEKTTTLDISYNEEYKTERENYRIIIDGKELINKYLGMLQHRRNHVIFNVMMNVIKDKKFPDKISFLKKTKNTDSTIDINDLNVRIRLATEEKFSDKEIKTFEQLTETEARKITFRYKQRLSVVIDKTENYLIKIDLTNVKSTQNINRLSQINPTYEIEIEYVQLKNVNKKDILDKLLLETTKILKVIQQSNFIITKTQTNDVLNEYRKIMNIPTDKTIFNLEGRTPVSLEIQHATEILANKYAAIDKADGERYFMIICFNRVFLISQNLRIKDTGIDMKDDKYNGTILDCEYIFLPKFKRYIILPFDCLFAKGEDIRKNPNLIERMQIAQKIVNDCFVMGKQKGFKYPELKDKNSIDNLVKFYSKQLDEYVDMLYHDLEHEKQYPLIRVKYFMPVYGLADNEIYKYSEIIWNKFMFGDVKYPYSLDGIIYQPINQAYITNLRESKFSDYKWKPPEKNTIDFYIKFAKDPATGKVVNVYDNSNESNETNKPYRICYLHNGKRTPEGEIPVYFNEEQKLHMAYLYLEDGNVKDVTGDILQDETVVEFAYNNIPELDEKFRWKPLKTRYDKTEMVHKYKMKYGNNNDIANRIWRSIIVPVRYSDITTLANDKLYYQQLTEMRSKITQELIISASKENVYYQIRTNLAEPMRNFHNWVKSVVIFTYMSSEYTGNKPLTVLDIGTGRGGDLMKFYHAKISSAVCMDIDYETLHNAVDGAISRYNGHKKRYPAFPKMSFVCADFTTPLDADSQMKVVQDKTPTNKFMLEKLFPKNGMQKFDRINAQFSFHYFLVTESAWTNACNNINKCLKPGGMMVITTFDAERILEVLGDNDKYTLYHNLNGEKKILMEIVKKFTDSKKIGVGMAIDVYNSLISNEDVYITEYLVDKTFLVKELKEKCNMELVDTDLFDHQFEINRENITNVANFDENEKTRKFLQTVATFYDQGNPINAECFKISRLNRYYVFRKTENE